MALGRPSRGTWKTLGNATYSTTTNVALARRGVDRNMPWVGLWNLGRGCAPRAGAWIETTLINRQRPKRMFAVAPRAGAWIETASPRWRRLALPMGRPSRRGVDRNAAEPRAPGRKSWAESPLARGRGSKLVPTVDASGLQGQPLAQGHEIETSSIWIMLRRTWSPLARGRGSKREPAGAGFAEASSPLAQGRGSATDD